MVGRRLAHYDILEKLGAGGMGVVYRARDTKLERVMAVKVVRGDGGDRGEGATGATLAGGAGRVGAEPSEYLHHL